MDDTEIERQRLQAWLTDKLVCRILAIASVPGAIFAGYIWLSIIL